MWTLAAQIPDGLLFGLAPTGLGLFFAWAAWVTISTAGSKQNTDKLDDHEHRLRALEARP